MRYSKGMSREYTYRVKATDFAAFEGEVIHQVYSTFSISRDAEWSGRQLLLEQLEESEEAVGTFVEVKHRAPAFLGEEVKYEVMVESFEHGFLNCKFVASVKDRVIAEGRTGQKIISKAKLTQLMDKNNY